MVDTWLETKTAYPATLTNALGAAAARRAKPFVPPALCTETYVEYKRMWGTSRTGG